VGTSGDDQEKVAAPDLGPASVTEPAIATGAVVTGGIAPTAVSLTEFFKGAQGEFSTSLAAVDVPGASVSVDVPGATDRVLVSLTGSVTLQNMASGGLRQVQGVVILARGDNTELSHQTLSLVLLPASEPVGFQARLPYALTYTDEGPGAGTQTYKMRWQVDSDDGLGGGHGDANIQTVTDVLIQVLVLQR
jgi:hypothetical protein